MFSRILRAGPRAGLLALMAVIAGTLTVACVLDRAPAPPARAPAATPIPTFTPTPRPMDSLVPTPTPASSLSRSRAEFLVWEVISRCANDVARSTQIRIEVGFSSSFDAASGDWSIQATIGALDLNLGLWEVSDEAGWVSPVDEVATAIASRQYVCSQPHALLSNALTPPSFAIPTPTPTPAPLPPVEAPAPTLTPTPTVIPTPTRTPAVASGTQAELRVWLAVRDCFVPPPPPERFKAYQDRADRWIVEGRMEPDRTNRQDGDETIFFGLWLVDRDTGRITPHDSIARRVRDNRFCFVEP